MLKQQMKIYLWLQTSIVKKISKSSPKIHQDDEYTLWTKKALCK